MTTPSQTGFDTASRRHWLCSPPHRCSGGGQRVQRGSIGSTATLATTYLRKSCVDTFSSSVRKARSWMCIFRVTTLAGIRDTASQRLRRKRTCSTPCRQAESESLTFMYVSCIEYAGTHILHYVSEIGACDRGQHCQDQQSGTAT